MINYFYGRKWLQFHVIVMKWWSQIRNFTQFCIILSRLFMVILDYESSILGDEKIRCGELHLFFMEMKGIIIFPSQSSAIANIYVDASTAVMFRFLSSFLTVYRTLTKFNDIGTYYDENLRILLNSVLRTLSISFHLSSS